MNADTAMRILRAKGNVTADPVVPDGELDTFLLDAAVVDENGYEPQDDDWTPTYSKNLLNLSIAAVWDWKAGELTGENFNADGHSFDPSARRTDYEAKADKFRRKVAGSFVVTGRTGRYENITGSQVVIN